MSGSGKNTSLYIVCVCFVFSLQGPYKLPEIEDTWNLQEQPCYYLAEDLTPGMGERSEDHITLE